MGVFKVDTVLAIGGQDGAKDVTIKSLETSDVKKECVRWDVHVNFWTRQGCKTLFSNSSHTTCEFDYISTYAVIKTLDEADDLKILPIVIISVTNCCVAGII